MGITRSVHGNLPHILGRMTAHNKAVMSVLPAGLARCHLENPVASLRIEQLYGAPVLLSGVASLVLKKNEIKPMQHHYKIFLERLQRLHKCSPEPVVFFMAGSLPLIALLHLRQLTLLGMIARLGPDNILHQHGKNVLNSKQKLSHSWFGNVKHICIQYSLPEPAHILSADMPQQTFKKFIKSKVLDYWEKKFRSDVSSLPSLLYFKADFYSLVRPHPIWQSAGNNPYEVQKATIQAKLLSGRYRSCWLSRHWSGNASGDCLLPHCHMTCPTPGTIEHLLLQCEDLAPSRKRILALWTDTFQTHPQLVPIFEKYYCPDENSDTTVQFLLDCSVLPDVIALKQKEGQWVHEQLFYLTRSYCFALHKARLRLLGRWS